jgi:outer membrane protein assembly factor BamB
MINIASAFVNQINCLASPRAALILRGDGFSPAPLPFASPKRSEGHPISPLRFLMKTKRLFAGCTLLLGILSVGLVRTLPARAPAPVRKAQFDWPQWQGPQRDNVSQETGLLKKWPKEGPKLLWTFDDAGVGYSGPAIVGDRLYTLGGDGDKEYLFALDLGKRKKVWSTAIGRFFPHGNGDGPRGTPTVDGERIYALGGHGDLVCVKADSGELLWNKNLKQDFGGKMMSGWGYSESPLVDGECVVCTPGGNGGTLAALDKKTGELRWRSKGYTDAAAYSSLVVSEAGGVRQYVQMTGQSVAGVAAKDGRLLWRFPRKSNTAAVPTPICFENYVYVSSGYGCGDTLLKLSSDGGDIKAEEIYANREMVNHHGGVVLVAGHVYGYSDSKGWICQDLMSGKTDWDYKERDFGKGSLTYADGHLYCYTEDGGKVALVEANPKGKWNVTGRFTIPQRSKKNRPNKTWTHPVVANGKLYLRDQELLFCYDIKDGGR